MCLDTPTLMFETARECPDDVITCRVTSITPKLIRLINEVILNTTDLHMTLVLQLLLGVIMCLTDHQGNRTFMDSQLIHEPVCTKI